MTICLATQVRSKLVHCGSTPKAKRLGFSDLKASQRSWAESWVPAMESCRSKYVVVAGSGGSGFSSAKQRLLGCGSVPLFADSGGGAGDDYGPGRPSTKDDTFFARWLRRNYHYLALNQTDLCGSLGEAVDWARRQREQARAIGANARRFASTLLGPRMVHEYLLTLLAEVARLQTLHTSRYGHGLVAGKAMVHMTARNLPALFEQSSKGKGGVMEAALAYWRGTPCPEKACERCCFVSPRRVRQGRGDLQDLGGSAWWKTTKDLSKGKAWSPNNRTRAFRQGMGAAAKIFR